MKPILALVLPCFNEEKVLYKSIPVILSVLDRMLKKDLIDVQSFILLVDDGSKDQTWNEIKTLHQKSSVAVNGLKLARNFGHQNAVLAGMMHVKDKVDICITMDCDLQDDPSVIEEMVGLYLSGKQVVYGVRRSRQQDTFAKRYFAQTYYKILKKLQVDIVEDHADYRLLSREVLEHLSNFKETNLFLRGLIPLIGYQSGYVYYDRSHRVAGESKYNVIKMLSLAIDGLSGFSSAPLILIIWLGFGVSFFALLLGIWGIIVKLFIGGAISGWASIVVPMYFLGGVQLLTLGIIGIYISKIFKEVKSRPRFIIEEELSSICVKEDN